MRYLGHIDKDDGNELVTNETYEVKTENIPTPTPDGRVMLRRTTSAFPVDNCLHPVKMKHYNVASVIYLSKLHADDRETYMAQVARTQEHLQQLRAQEAGLIVPTSGGGLVRPGH
jgi:hypothetical protein